MENFLKQKFGFHNIEGQYIVSGVRAFKLSKPISQLEPNKKIYFPYDQYHNPCIMTVDEIRRWQNSYVVYADGNARNMNKKFLSHALQRRSENGSEAFCMKFVVRMSDCPILMKFDAKISPRSLQDDWPNRIKLVSVTGIDFAGREHDVDDITTYIRNWQQVFELD
ncbi:unnamed protein product [Rotaria sp. Silwood1]|nr:unnamed protein product [Rotaria sp. Silwood1]CAF4963992.1 unnamed protein product [Rotaria sp. Silwood1]